MKAPLIALLLAVSLTGCQAASLTGAKTGTTASAIRLGNLQFQPASAATMARLSSQASNSAAAPQAASATAGEVKAGGAAPTMAIAPSPYGFGTYFGGPFGQMKLDSVTEATAAAVAGGFLETQANVVAPAVADWASDARLLGSNGTLDEAGNPIKGTETYPGELAWHATYASDSRTEVLEFQVGATGTKVVRMHWTPVTIDAAAVKVDAKAAVDILAKAVVSRVRSKEEELGHDYFFDGSDYAKTGVGIAVPAIAIGEPAPGGYQGPTTETLYRLKPGGRWYVNLQAIGDHLVWELSYNPNAGVVVAPGMDAAVSSPAMPASAPRTVMQTATTTTAPVTAVPVMAPAPDYQPQPWTDENAYGMVDAKTGELIRLRRPTSYTYPTGGVKPNTGTAVQGSAGGSTGTTPDGKL
jgi:hypothetical protein